MLSSSSHTKPILQYQQSHLLVGLGLLKSRATIKHTYTHTHTFYSYAVHMVYTPSSKSLLLKTDWMRKPVPPF